MSSSTGLQRRNTYLASVDSEIQEETKQQALSLTQKVFAKLLADPDNAQCLDCGKFSFEKKYLKHLSI